MIAKAFRYVLERLIGVHVHSWSKWETSGTTFDFELFQKRTCTVCGKIMQESAGYTNEGACENE